jgi:hypothetical protein
MTMISHPFNLGGDRVVTMGRLDSSVEGVAPGSATHLCVFASVSIPSLSFGVREMGRVKSTSPAENGSRPERRHLERA